MTHVLVEVEKNIKNAVEEINRKVIEKSEVISLFSSNRKEVYGKKKEKIYRRGN